MKTKNVNYNAPEKERCVTCGVMSVPYKNVSDGVLCYSCANRHPDFKHVQRTEPKIGRNDKCPCRSGKKYKNCCGIN